ncbi:MAG: YlbF family regulator [Chloroflexi bacterium]|nr:YlbF family regulator [Chloroflexota bacterium]
MITKEMQETARMLGEALHATSSVQNYLQAQTSCAADLETTEMENRLLSVYQELIDRQQHGDVLERSEIEDFNALKRRVREQPLIRERDDALGLVKQAFLNIANDINFSLGVEFPALALASKE